MKKLIANVRVPIDHKRRETVRFDDNMLYKLYIDCSDSGTATVLKRRFYAYY